MIQNAVRALEGASGTITDRVMAAMEAADAAGGDSRCSCTSTPLPKGACVSRSAMVAYIIAADTSDSVALVHTDKASYIGRQYSLFLYVTDVNTAADESTNPIVTLRRRYDAWKRRQAGRQHLTGDRAARALSTLMVEANRSGASPSSVS